MIFDLGDLLFIIIGIILILFSIIVLKKLKNREIEMSIVNKANKDMIDLETITKNIERDYKPTNIELTSYEQEQEDNAIISYQELLKNRDNNNLNYDENYQTEEDIDVKKINLTDHVGPTIKETTIHVQMMNYDKEEAFLKALKKLQQELIN